MAPPSGEKKSTSRPAVVPRLALQSALSPRLSPRAPGYPTALQGQRRSLGASCARSSPRLCLGSPKAGSDPEIRISPRFGRASQPDLAEHRDRKAGGRRAKAEAAHISRRRDSGMSTGRRASSNCIEQKAQRARSCGQNPCIGGRRPNPLLGGNIENSQAVCKQGPLCERSPSFSELGESSINESSQTTFEAVLEERASYMSLFGDEDSDFDIDACSFTSYGDKVTELCQRAESLVRDMSQDLDASMSRSASPPPSYVAALPLQTSTPLDEEDPSTWPSSATCAVTQALFAELGASSTPLPTPPVTPSAARTLTELPAESSSFVGEEGQHTQPASSPCPLQELGAIVSIFGTPPATPVASRMQNHSPSPISSSEDDPSLWPDLQPWLRSMCTNPQAIAGSNAPKRKEGGVQLSDLQFRVSRLELQVGQITSAHEKPSVTEEVAELRKHVEAAQVELQATRSEARETQEQLRRLLQYAGAGLAEVVAGGPLQSGVACPVMASEMPTARGGRVFRSASVSSQESQAQTLRQAASAQPLVAARTPVQMPRARSEDSGGRRRFYPLASSKQLGSEKSLPGCGNQDKPATKRKSFPSPLQAPRVVDVPVRMCTSQQLVQVVKQKPMWLKKVADNYVDRMVSRSSAGTGPNPSPPLRSRGLKSERLA